MVYKTLNNYSDEPHPWGPYIPFNANKLIIGSFPTAIKNRTAYEFFYPNPNNNFWNIIFDIAGEKIQNYEYQEPIECRKQILTKLNLGIVDMGKRVLRHNNSSKDDNLFLVEYTDIFSLLDISPSINKLILTSLTVFNWFGSYSKMNNIQVKNVKGILPLKSKIIFNHRDIDIEVIASTSRQVRKTNDVVSDMYRKAILI